jgi:hypothetical protein
MCLDCRIAASRICNLAGLSESECLSLNDDLLEERGSFLTGVEILRESKLLNDNALLLAVMVTIILQAFRVRSLVLSKSSCSTTKLSGLVASMPQ